MGLDMYLTRKKYIGSNRWDAEGQIKRGVVEIKVLSRHNGEEIIIDNPEEIKELVFDAGYWRKASQIHNWFVEHVQEGEDDCREYDVDFNQLKELLDTVNKVLEASELVDGQVVNGQSFKDGSFVNNYEDGKIVKNPTVAQELLPTQSGFFFGSEGYDQWYIDDLINTKEILEKALSHGDDYDFTYRSSW